MRDTSALTGAWHPMLGSSFIFTLSYPIYHLLLSEAQRGIMKKEVQAQKWGELLGEAQIQEHSWPPLFLLYRQLKSPH